jgi:hypothetical protein
LDGRSTPGFLPGLSAVVTRSLVVLVAGALLATCASGDGAAPVVMRGTRPAPQVGWLQGACLAIADPELAGGTPVQVVRLERPQRVVAATVKGRATSAQDCKPMLEGRKGLVDSRQAHFYTVTPWSDDNAEMAIGVIGAADRISIANGRAQIDLNGDGTQEIFGVCATSESIRFGLWPSQRFDDNAVWTGTYELDYDLQPSCPPSRSKHS